MVFRINDKLWKHMQNENETKYAIIGENSKWNGKKLGKSACAQHHVEDLFAYTRVVCICGKKPLVKRLITHTNFQTCCKCYGRYNTRCIRKFYIYTNSTNSHAYWYTHSQYTHRDRNMIHNSYTKTNESVYHRFVACLLSLYCTCFCSFGTTQFGSLTIYLNVLFTQCALQFYTVASNVQTSSFVVAFFSIFFLNIF